MRRLLVLLLFGFSACLAGCDLWSPHEVDSPWALSGLDGRDVQELVLRNGTLYAATDDGLYRMPLVSDAGWATAGLQGTRVVDVTWRADGRMLAGIQYDGAASGPVLYRQTTPSSTEWVQYDAGYGPEHARSVRALAAVPTARDSLFARGVRNVARSVDGGQQWTSVWGTWDEIGYQAPLLHVSSHDPSVVFAGGETSAFQPYLVRSADYGDTWASVSGPLSEGDNAVYSILEHPEDPDRLLLGMEGRVMRSDDGGLSWTLEYEPPGYTYIFDFAVRREGSRTIVYAAGSENGTQGGPLTLHRSDDFGSSWQQIGYAEGPESAATRALAAVEANGRERVYLGTTEGVYVYRP